MNGFKYAVLALFLVFASCTQRYVNTRKEILYVVYRGVPQNLSNKFAYYKDIKQYIGIEKPRSSNLLLSFDDDYSVIRLGDFDGLTSIDSITAVDNKLDIRLRRSGVVQDAGYPVLLQTKNITNFVVYSNDIVLFSTNI